MIVTVLTAWGCGRAAAVPDGVHTATGEVRREGRAALPVRVTWPDGPGPYPVIVFSHGLGGSRDAYGPLVNHWAAHGYVVLQPTHPDSLQNRPWRDRLRSPEELLSDPELRDAWRERIREVGLVLDRLDALVEAVDGLEPGHLDRERVGVGGHSFGAHTAALAGGMTLAGRSFREPRADAVLLVSPQGTGQGIDERSYRALDVPTMMITGSEDASPVSGQGPEWRLEAWQGLGGPGTLLWLEGADHAFGGISGWRGSNPEQVACVQEATTAFWDARLRQDRAARERLESGDVPTCVDAKGRFETRRGR